MKKLSSRNRLVEKESVPKVRVEAHTFPAGEEPIRELGIGTRIAKRFENVGLIQPISEFRGHRLNLLDLKD